MKCKQRYCKLQDTFWCDFCKRDNKERLYDHYTNYGNDLDETLKKRSLSKYESKILKREIL